MEEQVVIAAEVESGSVLQDLERRVVALEAALLRSVEASASGRKTVTTVARDGAARLELTGLSPEQRIAVKAELIRSGLI